MIHARRRRWLLALGVVALFALGAAMSGAGAEFGFWQALGRATGTRDDLGAVDFAKLTRRSSPNDALIHPPGAGAAADAEAPVFNMSAARLADALRAVALAEPRTLELPGAGGGRLRFVQRSFLMRYPDVIDVLVIARDDGTSTLALYSRSAVGHSDLGVNRARLERWLAALKRA